MRFEKFVKKHQVWIYGAVIVPLVVSLVLWGNPSSGGDDKSKGIVGTFTLGKTYEITGDEYRAMYRKIMGLEQYQLLQQFQRQMQQGQFRGFPSEAEIAKRVDQQTWESLILLQHARDMNVRADIAEVRSRIRMLGQPDQEAYARKVNREAHVSVEVFEEAVQDFFTVSRLLDMVGDATFVPYQELFAEAGRDHRKAKVLYTSFEDREFAREIRPVAPRQVIHQYHQKYRESKASEKIQIDYLYAEFKAYKDKVADPSEDEMLKYYRENQPQFVIPEEPKPGEPERERPAQEKQPPKFKSYETVKNEIRDQLKLKKAQDLVYKKMKEAHRAIGELKLQLKPKPGEAFDIAPIAKRFEVQYGETGFMAEADIDQFEKEFGMGSDLQEEAFHGLKESGFINRVVKTTEGCLIYRLLKKKKEYPYTVIGREHREKIVKAVSEDYQSQAASQKANDFIQEIKKKGIVAAARDWNLTLQATPYFTRQDRAAFIDAGADGPRLASESLLMASGEAKVVLSVDRKYVLYCEDNTSLTPEEVEKEVNAVRRGKIQERRRVEQEKYKDMIVRTANLKKTREDKDQEEEPAPVPPSPGPAPKPKP